MGEKSKTYTKNLTLAVSKADTDVNRCQQFMIGIDGSRENINKAISVIETKMKLAPAKSFSELAKTDPDVKKAGESYERSNKELEDYKTKFAKTITDAGFSIAQAEVILKNFQSFCDEKAKSWNLLRKKSLSKSLAALLKASTDLSNLRKFIEGMVSIQKEKGNYG